MRSQGLSRKRLSGDLPPKPLFVQLHPDDDGFGIDHLFLGFVNTY
jgi:hypothetical protein